MGIHIDRNQKAVLHAALEAIQSLLNFGWDEVEGDGHCRFEEGDTGNVIALEPPHYHQSGSNNEWSGHLHTLGIHVYRMQETNCEENREAASYSQEDPGN